MPLGTRTRAALDLENAMGDLGVSLGGFAGTETAGLAFSALKRNVAPALDILAEVALNPTFPEQELTRERKRMLDGLAQAESDPQSLAFRVMPMLVYGREHPYGRPNDGNLDTVPGLQRADLVAYHKDYWKPATSALVFVGDITLDEALKLARASLGEWSGGAAPEVPLPAAAPAATGKVYLVDRQGAPQSVVLQVLPAPARNSADYDALTLADSVWGGSFGSRLNLSLREAMGATYGANSFLSLGRRAGMWGAYTAVQTDKTGVALQEMQSLLRDINGGRPITEKELEDNRVNLVRSYAQEFETLGGVGGKVSRLWGTGMPYSELQREPEGLGAVTLSGVNGVAHQWADPAKACILVIGDRTVLEPQLKNMGVGDIVVLDTRGRPVAVPH
jgi:zinc protease